jgi:hypothetical protein
MANAFSPRTVVTNPAELFGRDTVMNQLISLANNGNSVPIIGPRRFGKTSILRCVETSLKQNEASRVYPVYFDFKEVGSTVKGTDNVYRYMVSLFVASLYKDRHFTDSIEIKRVRIKPSPDWEDVFDGLMEVNPVRIQGLLEELLDFFSELLGKGILFLIDEYEWLFRFSFDEPVGFMKLRNLCSKQLISGANPFSFWIAGSTPWDYLCSVTGSPELNVMDTPVVYVGNIDHESFCRMWQFEVSKLDACPESLDKHRDSAYKASGGIPFYGKLLGSHLLTSEKPLVFILLKHHLQELYDSLQSEEKTILTEISRAPRNMKSSKFLHELVCKGLVAQNGKSCEVRSGFLREFINNNQVEDLKGKNDGPPECHILTDRIEALIMSINQTHHNKRGRYIFEPVVDDSALMKDLRTPCYSLDLFSDFASSLYKIVFERTKDTKGGLDSTKARLPKAFVRNNQFIDIVDILRHSLGGGHLMDNFIVRKGHIGKVRMLEILTGSRNEPSEPDDFYHLQVATLKLFQKQLEDLNAMVRSIPN